MFWWLFFIFIFVFVLTSQSQSRCSPTEEGKLGSLWPPWCHNSLFYLKIKKIVFFFFFVVLWSQSADKLTIHSIPCSWILWADHSSKSTLPFAGLQHMQQCQVRVFHNFVPSFDPNEWCLNNGLHSGGLNPGPLCHESSALTTRPRLLAN